jgi:3-oxoacyl-[acyl-carrier protein] reductase
MDVSGKTVLVAGGAGSLGSEIAESLRARGANVVVIDAREPSDVQLDATDDAAVGAAIAQIAKQHGKISVLVNCMGLIHSEPLVSLTNPTERRHRMSTWNATIASNLTATFVLGSHAAEHMATTRSKGVIVNFSSIAASGNPGQSAYAAAKAGVEAMTVVWARELGPLGIRAVAIAPGFVATPSTDAAMNEQALSDLKRRTPLMRLAKPAEISAAVEFAIANDFLTGTTISVDGGLVL